MLWQDYVIGDFAYQYFLKNERIENPVSTLGREISLYELDIFTSQLKIVHKGKVTEIHLFFPGETLPSIMVCSMGLQTRPLENLKACRPSNTKGNKHVALNSTKSASLCTHAPMKRTIIPFYEELNSISPCQLTRNLRCH